MNSITGNSMFRETSIKSITIGMAPQSGILQEQSRIRSATQDLAPGFHHLWRDLILRCETSEHQVRLTQCGQWSNLGHRVGHFERQIAAGQAKHSLDIEWFFLRQNYLPISNDVVVAGQAGCGIKVEPGDDQRRWFQRDNAEAANVAERIEIDKDIYFASVDCFCRGAVRES
jgi:hypothetical protein